MTARSASFPLLVVVLLLAASTIPARGAGADTDPGVGTDGEAEAHCLGCHATVRPLWANLSSHSLLFDCTMCHEPLLPSGPDHVTTPACATCHSEASHPDDAACTTCHDPHGSANAFLVRETIKTPEGAAAVHVTRPEGATADGLVRQGVESATAGTGLCEVCHASTTVYRRDGAGEAHDAAWCATCHDHANGMASPPPSRP